MAATAFNTVIGVLSFIIGATTLIKAPSDQGTVAVSIWNGQPDTAYGGFPKIVIRGTLDERLGEYHERSKKIGRNAQVTVDVPMSENIELKMVGLEMTSTDGICATTISWDPSSNIPNARYRRGFVVGDLFYFCGRAWAYSGQIVYDYGVPMSPRCGWIDADNTAPGSTKYININTDIMSTTNLKYFDANKHNICHWGFGTGTAYSARSLEKRASDHMAKFGNQVQVSKHLSAVELCDSETSWGPSFYSIDEKILCDMSTKTKIPLCEDGNTTGCFNYVSPRTSRNNSRKPGKRRGFIQTPSGTRNFNVTYFTLTDFNGTVVDDGFGY